MQHMHDLLSQWNYLFRVTDWGAPDTSTSTDILKPLENAIRTLLIPALSGQSPPNEQIRDMLALPARLGGLGLINPVATANNGQSVLHSWNASFVKTIPLRIARNYNTMLKTDTDLRNELSRKNIWRKSKDSCRIPSGAAWSFPKRRERQPG